VLISNLNAAAVNNYAFRGRSGSPAPNIFTRSGAMGSLKKYRGAPESTTIDY
jgi:hypothetical protein